jgi:hypothetical protein
MDTNQQYGQTTLNLPHDVMTLPSQGLFYKNKKKSIRVGYLTAQDENLLMSLNYDTKTLISTLVRQKIYEPDIRIEDLLESDVEAILIFLRNTAFGTKYNLSTVDPLTNIRFDVSVDIDELNIKELPIKPDDNGLFSVNLPKSNDTVKFKLLTYGEKITLEKELDTYPSGIVPPTITRKLEASVISINGNDSRENIVKYIQQMPIMDSQVLRHTIRDCEPRFDLSKTVKAPSGEMVNVSINFGLEFFRPFFGL